MPNFIEIDGSLLEGGGQVIRNCVAYSAITSQPLKIVNVRANRKNGGGLRYQHLAGVKEVARLVNAELEGAEVTSKQFTIVPDSNRTIDVVDMKYKFKYYPTDIFSEGIGRRVPLETGGAISLIVQCILPILLVSPTNLITYEFEGGTHVPMAPPIEFVRYVFCHYFNHIFGNSPLQNQPLFELVDHDGNKSQVDSDAENGVEVDEELLKGLLPVNAKNTEPLTFEERKLLTTDTSFDITDLYTVAADFIPPPPESQGAWVDMSVLRVGFTNGGGVAQLKVKPVLPGDSLPAFDLSKPRGKVTRVRMLVAFTPKIKKECTEAFVDGAQNMWRNSQFYGRVPCITVLNCKMNSNIAEGSGAYAILIAETENGYRYSQTHLFQKNEDFMYVGNCVVRDLIRDLESEAAVDRHLEDQLIIFAAMAEGVSKIRVSKNLEMHTLTAIHWAKEVLGVSIREEDVHDQYGENCMLLVIEGIGVKANFTSAENYD
eukprot:GDKJ01005368.1.p1 GENE.GDKJ01005368.1~~GDKJ01005368.1.p1  ORF type:complete len:487 (-),score=104.30 GDKJ01005368.1:73-1533(-)